MDPQCLICKSDFFFNLMVKKMQNLISHAAAAAKSLQSCPTLCDPIDGSPPGSPVPGILQARTLEWDTISFSNAWKWKVKVKSLSHVWLFSNPMDCSLPGSSVPGILQARVLEWVPLPSPSVLLTIYQNVGIELPWAGKKRKCFYFDTKIWFILTVTMTTLKYLTSKCFNI